MIKHSLWTISILKHEILMTFRQSHRWVTSFLFFIMVVCLFPFALGSDSSLLAKVVPAIIWIAALLSILLSVGNIFQNDVEEGHLEQLILSQHALSFLIFCKILSHWLTNCLPLILVTPLLGFGMHLTLYQGLTLAVSLLVGTPALSLWGSTGAALIVGTRNNGLLLPVLIMPLYVPILIFGAGIGLAVSGHQPLSGYFAILGALSLFSLGLAPVFTSMALRIGINQ